MLRLIDLPDESLMNFIRTGHAQAFNTLVERHHKRFYHMCYRWVLNQEDAEDIVQQAFMKLWSGQAKWKGGKKAKFTTWFYTILYNQSIDLLRKRRYKMTELHEHTALSDDNQESDAMTRQKQEQVQRVLSDLPEKQRIAVNLFYFEEMKQKDIARCMGLTVKALESHLSRARASLRERMIEVAA